MKDKLTVLERLAKAVFGAFAEGKKWTESELQISQREVGGKVELIDGEGKLQPAPDGDYEMADGFKFTVNDGQISAIEGEKEEEKPEGEEKPDEQAEETPADAPKDETQPESNKEVEELKAFVGELAKVVADLQAQIAEMKQGQEQAPVAASKEEVEEMNKQLTNLFSALKKISFESSKTNGNPLLKDDREVKLTALQKILNKK